MKTMIAGGAGWTEAMDAELLERRDKRLPWRSVAPIGGMNEKRCQTRYRWLKDRQAHGLALPGPAKVTAAEVAKAREEREELELEEQARNGVDWLLKKRRLSQRRFRAAEFYRKTFRDGGGATGAIRSGLNVREGGAGVGDYELVALANVQAGADLHALRTVALWSQDDLLTVIDGVCGIGMTPRQLAGGDGHKAATLEAVLMVALDLVARWLDMRARKDG